MNPTITYDHNAPIKNRKKRTVKNQTKKEVEKYFASYCDFLHYISATSLHTWFTL